MEFNKKQRVDKDNIIKLNSSTGKKSKFDVSINTQKALSIWKSNVIGFDILVNYYRYNIETVLDVGCRVGVLSSFLKDLNYNVIGIELVDEFVREGRKHGINILEGDARSLPFKDNSFDAVFCRDMIEHIPDPDAVFAESIRVVRPGGIVFLIGPIEPKPSVKSHFVSWISIDDAKEMFINKFVDPIYFGLIEDEPITNLFNKKMLKQSLKRETFVAFLEIVK